MHFLFQISGTNINSGSAGASWYNTGSFTFFPSAVGRIYQMRLDGVMSSSTGNPIFHIDFERTGIISTGSTHGTHVNASMNRQSHDFDVVRGALGHSHFHMIFLVYADHDLYVSGAQFYCSTDGAQTVTFSSATLFIEER